MLRPLGSRLMGIAVLSMLASIGVRTAFGAADPAAPIDISVHEGTMLAMAVSPDQQTMVIDLQGTLFTLPVKGGKAKQITDEFYDARQPTWSPDGKRIAFQSSRDGTWHLWTVAPDGSNAKMITSGPFDDREPHWSPDGKRIAFASDRSGNYDIWELTVAGGAVRQITKNPGNDFTPSWSPDGHEIAFVSTRQPNPGVYAITPAGEERLVAAVAGGVGTPSWSPDGTVLYSVYSGGDARLRLGNREIVAGEDIFPFRAQWLDGDTFIYTSDGLIKRRSVSTGKVENIPFEATLTVRRAIYPRKHRNFDAEAPRQAQGIMRPSISPDGKQVAFVALGDLWLLDIGNPKPRRLTNDEFLEADPSWSRDGSQLVYTSERGGSMDLWVRDMRTGVERQLTKLPGAEIAGEWSPDGKSIAFVTPGEHRWADVDIVDVASGKIRKISPQILPTPVFPTWSADGRTIIVPSQYSYSTRFNQGVTKMLAIPVDGGEPRTLTPTPHQSIGYRNGNGGTWSPDGHSMAFVVNDVIYVMPVKPNGDQAGPMRKLTKDLAAFLSWTGDSQRLMYLGMDGLRIVSVNTGRVESVPLDLEWTRSIPTTHTVVHAGQMFDGVKNELRSNVDIVIDGHRIRAIEPHSDTLHTGRVVDASAYTIMPGLIEGHSHVAKEYGDRFGRIHLSYGITSYRGMANPPYEIAEMRESIDSGRRVGPRIFLSGYMVDGPRYYYYTAVAVSTEADVDRELERARKWDYDLLKTYVRLPEALRKRAIEGAHRLGIPSAAHEFYPAAKFGQDTTEHLGSGTGLGYSGKTSRLGLPYQDAIEIMSKAGMAIAPTTSLYGFVTTGSNPDLYNDPRFTVLQPHWMQEIFGPKAEHPFTGLASVGGDLRQRDVLGKRAGEVATRLMRAGIRIIAGTDATYTPYGLSLHTEIEQYVLGGMTPFEALQTATINVATVMGADKDLGSLEPGKLADLVAVEGNPLLNIRDARRVKWVIKNGELFSIESLVDVTKPLLTSQ